MVRAYWFWDRTIRSTVLQVPSSPSSWGVTPFRALETGTGPWLYTGQIQRPWRVIHIESMFYATEALYHFWHYLHFERKAKTIIGGITCERLWNMSVELMIQSDNYAGEHRKLSNVLNDLLGGA